MYKYTLGTDPTEVGSTFNTTWLTWVLFPSSFDSRLQCIWITCSGAKQNVQPHTQKSEILPTFWKKKTHFSCASNEWWANLSRFCFLRFRSWRLYRLDLLLGQRQCSGDWVRSGGGEIHQRVNAVSAWRKRQKWTHVATCIETSWDWQAATPLTWRPPGTCQALKATRGNTCNRKKRGETMSNVSPVTEQKMWGACVVTHLSLTPSLSSCLISAMTALGSNDFVFSSTQFSGSKSGGTKAGLATLAADVKVLF